MLGVSIIDKKYRSGIIYLARQPSGDSVEDSKVDKQVIIDWMNRVDPTNEIFVPALFGLVFALFLMSPQLLEIGVAYVRYKMKKA